jgi:hypothetical protein
MLEAIVGSKTGFER